MKRFLLLFLALPVFAAPSTPITRGRLTTDLDAGGHTVTNSNLATTNFVWEVVGAVTNNLPSGGGITTNDVREIIKAGGVIITGVVTLAGANYPTDDAILIVDGRQIRTNGNSIEIHGEGNSLSIYGMDVDIPEWASLISAGDRQTLPEYIAATAPARTNLPPLSASATVGDLVDRVNAVIGALR